MASYSASGDAPPEPSGHAPGRRASRRPGPAAPRTWWAARSAVAAVVHARLRHRQRGLLPARRHSANPRSRLHRCRRRGLLGRGQARRQLHACGCWRPACRRSRSCTSTSAIRCDCAYARLRRDVLAIECRLDGEPKLRPLRLARAASRRDRLRQRAAVDRYRRRRVCGPSRGRSARRWRRWTRQQRDAIGRASAGYVGSSDGWQDFPHNGAMTWEYRDRRTGQCRADRRAPRRVVLALGFGSSAEVGGDTGVSAACCSRSTACCSSRSREWQALARASAANDTRSALDLPPALAEEYLVSTIVLRTHQDKTYPGAMVASLSIPWGDSGNERGGYHLVWPRDLVEMRRRAAGARRRAGSARYVALPDRDAARGRPLVPEPMARRHALLGGHSARRNRLSGAARRGARRARGAERHRSRGHGAPRAGLHCAHGSGTEQDRWEESTGINPFTLAVCIAALVAGAELLPAPASDWALELADFWNSNIERWTSVSGTALAKRLGVSGYYVLVLPAQIVERAGSLHRGRPDPQSGRRRRACPATNWSAPSSCSSFGSACAAPMTR